MNKELTKKIEITEEPESWYPTAEEAKEVTAFNIRQLLERAMTVRSNEIIIKVHGEITKIKKGLKKFLNSLNN